MYVTQSYTYVFFLAWLSLKYVLFCMCVFRVNLENVCCGFAYRFFCVVLVVVVVACHVCHCRSSSHPFLCVCVCVFVFTIVFTIKRVFIYCKFTASAENKRNPNILYLICMAQCGCVRGTQFKIDSNECILLSMSCSFVETNKYTKNMRRIKTL